MLAEQLPLCVYQVLSSDPNRNQIMRFVRVVGPLPDFLDHAAAGELQDLPHAGVKLTPQHLPTTCRQSLTRASIR